MPQSACPQTSTINTELLNSEASSFVKLHATVCFLMTQFYSHQCPKLAQFIVRHLSMMIEHAEVANSVECRSMYLQLQQQWQNISIALLAQRKAMTTAATTVH